MDGNGHQHTDSPAASNLSEHFQVATPVEVLDVPAKRRVSSGAFTSKLGLDKLTKSIDWGTYISDFMYFMAVFLVVGGLLYWKFYMNGMATKSLTVGGYTYSFNFVRSASATQNSNGMRGYQTDYDHIAVVGPETSTSQLCDGSSSQYTLAFTVRVYGNTLPVCKSQDSQGNQIYSLSFASQNHFHEFMVTYGNTPDANTYPKLKSIFESISVSK